MATNRINFKALRRSDSVFAEDKGKEEIPKKEGREFLWSGKLSRRGLIGWGAFTGISLAPTAKILNAVAHAKDGSFTYEATKDRIVFFLNGRESWVIDTSHFDGHPRLSLLRQSDILKIQLQGARFPGTCLPADFVCHIRRETFGSTMTLAFSLGGFQVTLPLEKWLGRLDSPKVPVYLDSGVCGMGLDGRLQLAGRGMATFSPDWRFQIEGPRLATFHGQQANIVSDSLELGILSPQAQSLVTNPGRTRTLLTLRRGNYPWILIPAFQCHPSEKIVYPDDAFTRLDLEAWTNAHGESACAVLAESEGAPHPVWFHPHMDSHAQWDEPLALPLVHTRYVRLFQAAEQRPQQALVAGFDSRPVSVKVNGCRMDVGAPSDGRGFELVESPDQRSLVCQPAIYRLAVPLAGGLVESLQFEDEPRLVLERHHVPDTTLVEDERVSNPTNLPALYLTQAPARKQVPTLKGTVPLRPSTTEPLKVPSTPKVVIGAGDLKRPPGGVAVLGRFIVPVVRPEDLLALRFEFRGWTLQVGQKKTPKMVRLPNVKNPTIVVHFPPQHIGEEAFLETAAAQSPDDPVYPDRYPIKAELSGESHLVFAVPNTINEIPYTLDALLDWAPFQLVVAGAAAPPPPPPLKIFPIPSLKGKVQPNKNLQIVPKLRKRGVPEGEAVRPQSIPFYEFSPAQRHEVRQKQESVFGRVRVILASRKVESLGMVQAQKSELGLVPLPVAAKARPGLSKGQLTNKPRPGDIFKNVIPIPPKEQDLLKITAIEAPYRLIVSPSRLGGWAHSLQPVVQNGRHELWHTRLGVRKEKSKDQWFVDERNDWYRTMRAIWSPDYREDPNNAPPHYPGTGNPFRASLDANDRHQLVHLMSNGKVPNMIGGLKALQKRYMKTERFMLSSLGAWMKTRYAEKSPNAGLLSIVQWIQHANMGRDQFVKVVYQGTLFPFGHQAAFIKVTERKFQRFPASDAIVAVLRQRVFIVVREPLKEFPGPEQQSLTNAQGRDFPFKTVQITTLETPNLDDPTKAPSIIPGTPFQTAFWPRVLGADFQFHLVGTDRSGNQSEFSMPLVFVESTANKNESLLKNKVRNFYASSSKSRVAFSGQKVAFAPSIKKGDTAFQVETMSFSAEVACESATFKGQTLTKSCSSQQKNNMWAEGKPFYFPRVDEARVSIPAVKALLGIGPATNATPVEFSKLYRFKGFGQTNPGQIFLGLLTPVDMNFSKDTQKSGGVASPSMNIVGVSRLNGPVGGNAVTTKGSDSSAADEFGDGSFDPREFFSHAKVIGGIPLSELFEDGAENKPHTGEGGKYGMVPSLKAEESLGAIKIPYNFVLKNIRSLDLAVFKFNNRLTPSGKTSVLTIKGTIVFRIPKPGDPATSEPEFNMDGNLERFQVEIAKCIVVSFKSLRLVKKHGKDLSPHPKLSSESDGGVKPVQFKGALEFVNKIQDLFKGDDDEAGGGSGGSGSGGSGGSSGGGWGVSPIIVPSLSSIKAGIAISVPGVTVGVFSLTNIKLTAAATIFFEDKPLLFRFAISEKNNPFSLTVWIFGGGGFFALEVDTKDGVVGIEALFEFGGKFAFDIGIATGGVYLMAGFYFSYKKNPDNNAMETILEGYLRMGGQIRVLAIITVSLEFKMTLQYSSKQITDGGNNYLEKKIRGIATLVVKIEILFFSVSVDLKVEKEFKSDREFIGTAALDEQKLVYPVSYSARPQLVQNRSVAAPPRSPKIVEMIDKQEWIDYANAFAA